MGWQDAPIVGQLALTGGTNQQPGVQPKWASAPIVDESTPAPSQPTSQPRGTAQEIGRQGVLTGRAVLEGLGDIASIPANALAGLGNLLLELDRRIAGNADRAVIPNQAQGVPQALDAAGVATPENDTERLVNTIARRATGAAATMGIGTAIQGAQGVTGAVGQTLASNPVIQAVGSATGPIAGEVARQSGAGPAGQVVADLAGSIAPAVVSSGTASTLRGGVRGGEQGRQTVQQNIETFGRVGTTPTVGQATESRAMRGTETVLARTPGGAGPIIQKAETQADELAKFIETRAAQLVRKTSAEQAGRQIQRSVSGEGGFIDRFKTQQNVLYDKLDEFIPKISRVAVKKTQAALSSMNQDIPGAPATSKFFKNARIQGIAKAFDDDLSSPEAFLARADVPEATKDVVRAALEKAQANIAHPAPTSRATGVVGKPQPVGLDSAEAQELLSQISDGKLPYEALKKLRTLVGREMADAGLASDVPRSQWKALYAALSDDLGQSVEGNPAAKAAWTRANNYTRAGMRRIEVIESVIDKNGGPEAVFRAATSGTKEGATTLRAVMQSVDNEGKKMISATVLRRLGIAKPGAQDAYNEKFSTETFLTNWNTLSMEAKRALFDRYGPSFRTDMDQVAKVAANLREGSQVFRNPSGTAQAATQNATVGALALAVGTGQLKIAGGIAASATGANLLSRLMRNPTFVRWLARSTKFPQGAYVGQVNALMQQAKQAGDEDLAQMALYLQQGPQKQPDQDEGRQQGQ